MKIQILMNGISSRRRILFLLSINVDQWEQFITKAQFGLSHAVIPPIHQQPHSGQFPTSSGNVALQLR